MEAVAEADHAIKTERIDDFDRKFLSADIAEAHGWVALLDGVTDSMHQVRLAHTHSAVEEQRVVGFRGLLGHCARSSMREFVGLAYNEGVEGVAVVENVIAAVEIQLGLLAAGCRWSRLNGLLFGADVLHFGA